MGWLEDAIAIKNEMLKFEEEKKHSLFIKNASDIPSDLSGFSFIAFSSDYDGPSPVTVLTDIITRCPRLKKVSIHSNAITWEEACSLSFGSIEEFLFSLDGIPGTAKLNAAKLKKLVIFAKADLTPIELLITPVPEIDFSGVPDLEQLELRHFQQVNPDNFANNKKLKKLIITESNLSDLQWLQNAKYSLINLYIDGAIEDCSGITCQKSLESVIINHSFIRDANPFLQLPNLKYLDLRYGNESVSGTLQNADIPKILISRRDGEIEAVRRRVCDLIRTAVMRIQSEDKRADNIDDLPELRKRIFLRQINQTFEERLKQHIQLAYKSALTRMEETDYRTYSSLSVKDTKTLFSQMAIEYYPFLTNEM